MEVLRKEKVTIAGGTVPVMLTVDHIGKYRLILNGETWAECRNQANAIILYEIFRDHIAEYDF